jgi:hypothetical protein
VVRFAADKVIRSSASMARFATDCAKISPMFSVEAFECAESGIGMSESEMYSARSAVDTGGGAVQSAALMRVNPVDESV